jgi:hypothetical protein
MKIVLVGSWEELTNLETSVRSSLDRNALADLISIETKQDPAYNLELGITQNPALCIEEETIDFRDMIFEGMIPADDELDAMFVSILGQDEHEHSGGWCGSCSTEWGCGTCGDNEESGDGCATDSCHSH